MRTRRTGIGPGTTCVQLSRTPVRFQAPPRRVAESGSLPGGRPWRSSGRQWILRSVVHRRADCADRLTRGTHMLQELDGKVAVITGGGSGIGAALAEACAAEGMRVVVADVNGERAESVASDLPEDTAYGKAVDVADAEQVQELADFAFDTFGAVHLLCNNAGVSPVGRIWDYSDEDF